MVSLVCHYSNKLPFDYAQDIRLFLVEDHEQGMKMTSRMVGRTGLEPVTNSLRGYCSTIELATHIFTKVSMYKYKLSLLFLSSLHPTVLCEGVAPPEGFEPSTSWSEATHSIH